MRYRVSDFNWLADTRTLQVEAYGSDPAELNGKEFADFVRWNVLAAMDELTEVLHETAWKPWSVVQGRKDDSAMINELVDVAHFVANLAVAAGCSDAEWEVRYRSKMQINRDRQASGQYGRVGSERTGWRDE